MMQDDEIPRQGSERTGRHLCIRCLAEVPAAVYLRSDHVCGECAATDEYPLKSTAEAPKPKKR